MRCGDLDSLNNSRHGEARQVLRRVRLTLERKPDVARLGNAHHADEGPEGSIMRAVLVLLLIALLTTCGSVGNPTSPAATTDSSASGAQQSMSGENTVVTQTIRKDTQRNPGSAADQDLDSLTGGNRDFAVDLYRKLAAGQERNLCFSPYSISLAFSLLYAGARGDTESQLARVFHFLPQDVQHRAFNALDRQLAALATSGGASVEGGDPFQFTTTNALWGQQGFPFRDAYLDLLAQEYGAGLQVVDFARQPAEVSAAINGWIADQTQDRIKDLVSPELLSPQTRLVLTNAVFFKASWAAPFSVSETRPDVFTLRDSRTVDVPMMYRKSIRLAYTEEAGYQAVQLPYVGQEVDMLVVLPATGRFDALAQQLDGDFFSRIRSTAQPRDVTLSMPRFAFATDLALPKLLQEMGMEDAFAPGANFGGIADNRDLRLSDALHRSTIAVDEQGTEATAATVAGVAESALERAELHVNQPFIFAIVDRSTDTILFLGHVMNPAQLRLVPTI